MSRNGTGPPPIFLFGFERSGTTLLSMMVGAHPEIAVPLSTTGLWYRYGDLIEGRYNGLRSRADLERLIDDLLGEERIRLWDAEFTREEVLQSLPRPDFPGVIEAFHSLYARKKSKPAWANIDIATIYDMDRMHAWFPEARFVQIVRDGRDVALSHQGYVYGLSNIGECADRWREVVATNRKMGAMLGPEQYLTLRYEDLILDSARTLRRLCDFLGVSYSDQMLEYMGSVDEKIPDDRRFLWPEIGNAPVASKAFGWRNKMSRSQRVVFEWKAGDLLKALDYETFDTVPKPPAAYALELWYFLDRGHRFRRLGQRLRPGSSRRATTP